MSAISTSTEPLPLSAEELEHFDPRLSGVPVGPGLHGVSVDPSFHVVPADVYASMSAAEASLSLTGVKQKIHSAPLKASIGLHTSSAGDIDYSHKLDQHHTTRLVELLMYFSGETPGFKINLDTLKDGEGNVLVPRPGQNPEEFMRNIDELRKLASLAIGTELSFTRYPLGLRTALDKEKAFSIGHSERLKAENLKFEKHHEEQRLDELQKEDADYQKRRNVLAMHVAAKGLMSSSKEFLQEMQNSDDINRDLQGEARRKKIATMQEQAPHEAFTLFGAVHSLPAEASPQEIQETQQKAKEFIESYSLPHADRNSGGWLNNIPEGILSAVTLGLVNTNISPLQEITEENQKAEKAAADQAALLSFPDRQRYEFGRTVLQAAERSDGQERFFVQLAYLAANAKTPQEIVHFINGPTTDFVMSSLDQVDRQAYREMMIRATLEHHRILSGIQLGPKPSGAIEGMEYVNVSDSSEMIAAFDKAFERRMKKRVPTISQQVSSEDPPRAARERKTTPLKREREVPSAPFRTDLPEETEIRTFSPRSTPVQVFASFVGDLKRRGVEVRSEEMVDVFDAVLPGQINEYGIPISQYFGDVFKKVLEPAGAKKGVNLRLENIHKENNGTVENQMNAHHTNLQSETGKQPHLIALVEHVGGNHFSTWMYDEEESGQFMRAPEYNAQGDLIRDLERRSAADLNGIEGFAIYSDEAPKGHLLSGAKLHNRNTCALISCAHILTRCI